jgi:hypothetical protein
MAIAARMPMIVTTTINSTSVKPFWHFLIMGRTFTLPHEGNGININIMLARFGTFQPRTKTMGCKLLSLS